MTHMLMLASAAGVVCAVVQTSFAQWTTAPITAPRVQYRTFASVAAGTTVSFHVYTPPAYDTQPLQRFPVLYWLHGSGSATSGIAPVSSWFAGAMSRGDVLPMIIVFPNGMPNGMYCDAANGTRPLETVIMQELIPHVDATFRTIADRRGRILEGFSMGGYGTGRLAFKYSDRFVAASMLGAGPVQLDFMNPPPGTDVSPAARAAIFADVWNSDPAAFFAASPWNQAQINAEAIRDNALKLRLAVGTSDAMLGPNADLHAHLISLNIPHSWQTYPGIGHDPLPLMQAMGADNWSFYRDALMPVCDSIDFNNNDVFPEDQDVIDLFNVLAGADCPACNDIDFNNNSVFPEDQDVIDFFNVLAGGTC
ncbi:MAG TPA: alpha/beta hydrolase-fold protein [Phycisphaerales bacterium]|nr:alpha/beta hydrolase-fold protein [Phycisphaerales bacterium]